MCLRTLIEGLLSFEFVLVQNLFYQYPGTKIFFRRHMTYKEGRMRASQVADDCGRGIVADDFLRV